MRPGTELFPGICVTECKDGGRCFLLVLREVAAAFRTGVEACVEAASAARAVFILFLCHEIYLLSVRGRTLNIFLVYVFTSYDLFLHHIGTAVTRLRARKDARSQETTAEVIRSKVQSRSGVHQKSHTLATQFSFERICLHCKFGVCIYFIELPCDRCSRSTLNDLHNAKKVLTDRHAPGNGVVPGQMRHRV